MTKQAPIKNEATATAVVDATRIGRIEADISIRAGRADGTDGTGQSGIYNVIAATDSVVDMGYYKEILVMSGCDLSSLRNNAIVLFNHILAEFIGVVVDAETSNGQLLTGVRFSKQGKGKDIRADVDDKIITKISIGYRVLEDFFDESRDCWVVTSWRPYEVSVVTLPADEGAGIDGQRNNQENSCILRFGVEYKKILQNSTTRNREMPANNQAPAEQIIDATDQTPAVNPAAAASNEAERAAQAAATTANVNSAVEAERRRVASLTSLASMHDVPRTALTAAINDGTKVEEFITTCETRSQEAAAEAGVDVSSFNQEPTAARQIVPAGDRSTKEQDNARAFNLDQAIQGIVTGKRNVSTEIVSQPGGMIKFPPGFLAQERDIKNAMRERASFAGSAAIEHTNTTSILNSLQDSIELGKLGAQLHLALQENQKIPVSNTTGVPAFKATGEAANNISPVFVSVALEPRRLPISIQIDRLALLNSSGLFNNIMKELSDAIGRGIQAAAFNGNGTAPNPTGITSTAGVGTVPDANVNSAVTYLKLLAAENKIKKSNIRGTGAWVMSVTGLAKWLTTSVSGTEAVFLAKAYMNSGGMSHNNDPEGLTVTGKKIYTTEMMPDSGANSKIYGVWQHLHIGFWENLSIRLDQGSYDLLSKGQIGVVCEAYTDIVVDRGVAFVKATA